MDISKPAADLGEAFGRLDPQRFLETPQELQQWFCERTGSPRAEVALRLRNDPGNSGKYLFSGHRGSGKTTELRKLSQELGGEFFCTHVSAFLELDVFDLDVGDLMFVMVSRLVSEGRDYLDKDVIAQVESLTEAVTHEVVTETPRGVSAEVAVDLKIVKVGGRIGKEAVTRTTVRREVNRRLGEFVDTGTLVAQTIQKAAGKPVLVIVDDLDKIPDLEKAADLFFKQAGVLLAPGFSVIYTFPIALRYHQDFSQIVRMGFSEGHVLPNFPVRRRDGLREETALERMTCIARNRKVAEDLIPQEQARELAWLSGGLAREFVRLAGSACIESLRRGITSVDGHAVEMVRGKGIAEFDVMLTQEQRRLLAAVHASRRLGENDEAHRGLLHNLSVLEYGEAAVRRYYDVNPLAEPLAEG
jgi:DNA polymerase III delta prime subunit